MNKTFLSAIALGMTSCLVSAGAFAASNAELENRIKRLEALLEQNGINADSAGKQAKVELGHKGLKIKSNDGDFSIKPVVRVQADAAFFNDDTRDYPDGTTLRRAWLGFKGNYDDVWTYSLVADLANDSVTARDVYIGYNGFSNTNLTVGNFKQPIGLEALTSSANITFLERSAGTDLFTPLWSLGAGAHFHDKNKGLSLGVFGDTPGTQDSDDEEYAFVGRAHYAPLMEDGKVAHVGAAARYFVPGASSDSIRYRSRPESRLSNSFRIVDTGTIGNIDNGVTYGLEGLAIWDRFSLQGEYMHTNLDRTSGNDLDFRGGYVFASLMLTDDRRGYDGKKGVAKSVSPNSPFSLDEGGYGAWEVAARYSMLDLDDGGITGGEYDGYTFALNWYPTKALRLMANYTIAQSNGNGVIANDEPHIAALRAQFNF